MKFNLWTLGLAAVGVVSLASAAKAEERVNLVQDTLSSTTISGYVDTSAQWNPGTDNVNMPPYRFGGADKADGFNLNVIQLRLERPLNEDDWAAGYRVDLWAGPDANTLNTASIFSGDPADFAIRQAYVNLRAPVGTGLYFKVGVFDSILGYESLESPNNPNYTRSYGHTIEPTTHTGMLATYKFSELFQASAGIANTLGPVINDRAHGPNLNPNGIEKAESYKTYMGSITFTAPESMGFLKGSTLYGGIVNGFSDMADGAGTRINYYAGTTLATPHEDLTFGACFDLMNEHRVNGETWSIAGYSSFRATEKMRLNFRAEYLRDRGDQKFFDADYPDKVMALTGTVQYDLWQNVISRLEVRWDHALDGSSSYSADPELKNAWMIGANIIYRF